MKENPHPFKGDEEEDFHYRHLIKNHFYTCALTNVKSPFLHTIIYVPENQINCFRINRNRCTARVKIRFIN